MHQLASVRIARDQLDANVEKAPYCEGQLAAGGFFEKRGVTGARRVAKLKQF